MSPTKPVIETFPREAPKPTRPVMNLEEVKRGLRCLKPNKNRPRRHVEEATHDGVDFPSNCENCAIGLSFSTSRLTLGNELRNIGNV